MSRDPRRRQEQLSRHMAYMTDDRTPDAEKGRVILALLSHAVAYLLLTAADATWIVAMAARVWRRREAGLSQAVRTTVHRPTLAVLLSAHLLYEILRRAVLARLNRGSSEYTVPESERA